MGVSLLFQGTNILHMKVLLQKPLLYNLCALLAFEKDSERVERPGH